MHPDEQSFLDAILAEPAEDTHRLVYADWLEEHGGQPDRAEFIRVQCELHLIPDPPVVPERGSHPDAVLDGLEALQRWRKEWSPRYYELRDREQELIVHNDVCVSTLVNTPGLAFRQPNGIRRGFVDRVVLTAYEWFAWADAILAAHPVRRVALTTRLTLSRLDVGSNYVRFQFPGRPVRRMDVPGVVHLDGNNPDSSIEMLAVEWPGIEFELPPAPRLVPGTILFDDDGNAIAIMGADGQPIDQGQFIV